MAVHNDTRGWILTCLSGLACMLGATVICIDLVVRLFPGKKNFKIQDSDGFLSCSLGTSAGVMLFSALYSMLPSSKESLQKGGSSPKAAAWILIACFMGGVIGIQVLSRVAHHFMPSHIVDCDHTHDEESGHDSHDHDHHSHGHDGSHDKHSAIATDDELNEATPLLPSHDSHAIPEMPESRAAARPRPSIRARMSSRMSQLISGKKDACDTDGPCFGYSDPCGKECFKNVYTRGGRLPFPANTRHALSRSATQPSYRQTVPVLSQVQADEAPLNQVMDAKKTHENALLSNGGNSKLAPLSPPESSSAHSRADEDHSHDHTDDDENYNSAAPLMPQESDLQASENRPHHHHVPTNAFLSIGLQTSIAIALHKLPEGFITYATNHANPKLGFNVFLALFIHNISEGFALALPLYLALNSRVKALLFSTVLGGLSQPLGAGVAAIWLHFAERGRGDYAPSERVYGGMFAATAGIMASVALALMQESFDLTHNKGLCMAFVFFGMFIMGASSALTA